jgi:hypothetical protein
MKAEDIHVKIVADSAEAEEAIKRVRRKLRPRTVKALCNQIDHVQDQLMTIERELRQETVLGFGGQRLRAVVKRIDDGVGRLVEDSAKWGSMAVAHTDGLKQHLDSKLNGIEGALTRMPERIADKLTGPLSSILREVQICRGLAENTHGHAKTEATYAKQAATLLRDHDLVTNQSFDEVMAKLEAITVPEPQWPKAISQRVESLDDGLKNLDQTTLTIGNLAAVVADTAADMQEVKRAARFVSQTLSHDGDIGARVAETRQLLQEGLDGIDKVGSGAMDALTTLIAEGFVQVGKRFDNYGDIMAGVLKRLGDIEETRNKQIDRLDTRLDTLYAELRDHRKATG